MGKLRLGSKMLRRQKGDSKTAGKKIPNMLAKILIGFYVLLWVVNYMLVHASHHPRYRHLSKGKLNPAFVMMLTEFIKLFMCGIIFLAQKLLLAKSDTTETNDSMVQAFQFGPVINLFKQYLPVAFLYAMANNLMINNLQHYDPTVYVILSSSRLIMTAALMRSFCGKKISQMQKIAILIITLGLLLQDSSSSSNKANADQDVWANLSSLALLLFQMLCGTLASVYNEALLKNRNNGRNGNSKPITNIFAANICLYIESILLNGLAVMLISHESADSVRANLNFFLSDPFRQGIIFTMATVGIVTSFILCHVDSLSKAVASASTVVFTTALGYIIFGYDTSLRTTWSSILVGVGVHSYTFSNITDESMTFDIVVLSLMKTLKQLWFIPTFFWLFNTSKYLGVIGQYQNDPSFDAPVLKSPFHENFRNEQWLDDNLHLLGSFRTFAHTEWQQYVRDELSSPLVLALLKTKGCRVLEIGCGRGAFSRDLLKIHEGVEVLGVDNSKEMLATSLIALQEFPTYTTALASMEDSGSMQKAAANETFHIAMMMDSLCYLPDVQAVHHAIANALRPLHPGGFLLASMIPDSLTDSTVTRHCTTAIPMEWINATTTRSKLGYDVMDLGSINEDGLYSFLLHKTDNHRTQESGLQVAAPDSPEWPIPEGLSDNEGTQQRIEYYRRFQDILEVFVTQMEQIGAPVILKWGTALHEFRSGAEHNFVPLFYDKDIDIALFPRHFPLIFNFSDTRMKNMKEDINNLGGRYRFVVQGRKKGILLFKNQRSSIQIDIYSFQCRLANNTIRYPWDKVTMRPETLLPVKPATRLSGVKSWNPNHVMYMPNDSACYLENIFGPDFRIPMKTKYHRTEAMDLPSCKKKSDLDATEKLEFMRQLMFCGICERANMNHDVIADFASGLPVTAEVCPDQVNSDTPFGI